MRGIVAFALLMALLGCVRSRALVRQKVSDSVLSDTTMQVSVPPTRDSKVLIIYGTRNELPDDWSATLTFKTSGRTISKHTRREELLEVNYLQAIGLRAYLINNLGFPVLAGMKTDVELQFKSPHRLEGLSLWVVFLRQ